jgi:hypothetical protein
VFFSRRFVKELTGEKNGSALVSDLAVMPHHGLCCKFDDAGRKDLQGNRSGEAGDLPSSIPPERPGYAGRISAERENPKPGTKLFRKAYPQLYLPVQPGVPLCNLETNFRYCKGIELLADFETYRDDTVVLHSWVFYHVRLRLEKDQPNFFSTAKAQRDRGEFALPRRYYVGALVEAIQKALPILQEIATDYRKYIKDGNQEIEIELTLEESRKRVSAKESDQQMKDAAAAGSGIIISALPSITFFAGLTISALQSGGRTFWEVLKEEKEFEICRRRLDLDEVEFSYTESFSNNFSHILIRPPEATSDIIIREIVIRLVSKDQKA